MVINWKMTIALILVAILGIVLISMSFNLYNSGVTIEEKCDVPWSDQTHRDDICTRTIYCHGINKIFYWDACKKYDAILGNGVENE